MTPIERNYGCRLQEISIYGFKSIILENEVLRTLIITDKGCEISEFNYKKMDLDFTWRTHNGLSTLKNYKKDYGDNLILTDYYSGGWFETFPICGTGGEYFGTQMPVYGEACYLSWDYIVLKDDEKEIIIKAFCKTIRSPFYLEKTIKIKSGIPELIIEDSIKNTSHQEIYFNIGYHPNLGKNFIDDNLILNIPSCEVEILASNDSSRFKKGEKGQWPFLNNKEGRKIDLRILPEKDSGIHDGISLKNLSSNFMEIKNINKNISFKVSFDKNIYKNAILWIVKGGDMNYPRFGRSNVVCLFPRSSHYYDIKDVEENKDFIKIKPDEVIDTWIKYEIY